MANPAEVLRNFGNEVMQQQSREAQIVPEQIIISLCCCGVGLAIVGIVVLLNERKKAQFWFRHEKGITKIY